MDERESERTPEEVRDTALQFLENEIREYVLQNCSDRLSTKHARELRKKIRRSRKQYQKLLYELREAGCHDLLKLLDTLSDYSELEKFRAQARAFWEDTGFKDGLDTFTEWDDSLIQQMTPDDRHKTKELVEKKSHSGAIAQIQLGINSKYPLNIFFGKLRWETLSYLEVVEKLAVFLLIEGKKRLFEQYKSRGGS